ncbi:protein of unknown function [Pseudonocardia thermophila]|uniref:HNH nuclease domain-containing protein n=2 Tax=Pseudonocardia thermophila TaxID=1848 RepID=A0A1M6T332_PSETH|nr:protein of unknown function [Pseudonocardia thermophila]
MSVEPASVEPMFDSSEAGGVQLDVPGPDDTSYEPWGPDGPWDDEWGPDGLPADPQLNLATAPASFALAMELVFSKRPLDEVDDAGVLATAGAWRRMAGWALSGYARALAEFARRRSGDPVQTRYAADEIAAELKLTRGVARRELDRATALDQHLRPTRDLWEKGELDEQRVAAIADRVRDLPVEVATRVQEIVLPKAPAQTIGQLRAAMQRAIIAVDPEGAEERHREAHAKRSVRMYPDADGMATLTASMSAPDAVACDERLTALARGLGADDPRSMGARRADLLVGLITGRVFAGELVSGPAEGGGPAEGVSGAAPCGSGVQIVRPAAPDKASVHVVVDLETLRGEANRPAELAGYGPITATQARQIAADAVWRRLVTDPLSGVALDLGRTTYRPPVGLADLVRARDGVCRFPGCRRRASACELDHVVPYPAGPTAERNVVLECMHHHHLKHDSDWRLEPLPDGGVQWTSPTGAVYRTYPWDHRPLTGRGSATADGDPSPP